MLSRVMPCPVCGHEHLWLDCDFCPCTAHLQPGVYLDQQPDPTISEATVDRPLPSP